MSRLVRFTILLILATCLTFSACSRKDKLAEINAEKYPHLQYIPADTPYALMALEPLPDEIADRFYRSYDQIMDAYTNIATSAYQGYLDKAQEENALDENNNITDNNWVQAISKEFEGGLSIKSFEKYGINKTSVGVLYGHGVLPVFRLRLSDTSLFKNAVERIEKNAGEKLPTLNIPGLTVWELGEKDLIGDQTDNKDNGKLLLALSDHDLIISFKPAGASLELVKQLLGVKLPKNSLGSSPIVPDLVKNKGYLLQGLGFIDFRQIMNRVVGKPGGVDKEFFALLELEDNRQELSNVCKTELTDLVSNVPRLIYGLITLNKKVMASESVIEVRPDLAKEMTSLTAAVPGLGEEAGFLSMGFSFDLAAIREFTLRRLDELEAKSFECEFLHIEPQKLSQARMAINNPAGGFAEGLRGFNFVIDDLDIDAIVEMLAANKGTKPDFSDMQEFMSEKFSANAVIAVDNTKTLYNMVKMFSPQAAALNLKADGMPVMLNEIFPEPLPTDVFVTMGKEAFVFTMGKHAETKAEKILKMKQQPNSPLFAYSVNMRQYVKIINSVLENPEIADEMSKEDEINPEDLQAILNAIGGLFESMTYSVGFREDGIILEQKVKLAPQQ